MKRKWNKTELDQELWRFFGKENYPDGLRDIQVKYTTELLSGQDCFAIMPTGGGKSICFQLAGLLTPGVTVVISPLVALIQEQTMKLNEKGISAVCIYNEDKERDEGILTTPVSVQEDLSSKGLLRRNKAYETVASGKAKFIYVTPERFRNAHFMVLLRRLQVNLLILDEVHCMSIWGHDFRRSYLDIIRVIRALPNRPVIGAFTATATPAVRKDLIELLGLKLPQGYFKYNNSVKREELEFRSTVIGIRYEDVVWYYKDLSYSEIQNEEFIARIYDSKKTYYPDKLSVCDSILDMMILSPLEHHQFTT